MMGISGFQCLVSGVCFGGRHIWGVKADTNITMLSSIVGRIIGVHDTDGLYKNNGYLRYTMFVACTQASEANHDASCASYEDH